MVKDKNNKDIMIQKQFIDNLYGFPVILSNVSMIKVRNIWTPNINYNELDKIVLLILVHKKSRLTEKQVEFARHFLNKTVSEFVELFGGYSKHKFVGLNDGLDDDMVNSLSIESEVMLRLSMLDFADISDEEKEKLIKKISKTDYIDQEGVVSIVDVGDCTCICRID